MESYYHAVRFAWLFIEGRFFYEFSFSDFRAKLERSVLRGVEGFVLILSIIVCALGSGEITNGNEKEKKKERM